MKTRRLYIYLRDAHFCRQQKQTCGQQQSSYTPNSTAARRNWRRRLHSSLRLDSQCSDDRDNDDDDDDDDAAADDDDDDEEEEEEEDLILIGEVLYRLGSGSFRIVSVSHQHQSNQSNLCLSVCLSLSLLRIRPDITALVDWA